jgi:hypothetical protein
MLRQELQSYFDRVYPNSKIETENTIGGQVHIRFELGGKTFENGTIERVNQATERAVKLFNDTFENPKNLIWILIYEYNEPNAFNAYNEYLYRQFSTEKFSEFYNQLEQVNTRILTTDKDRNDVFEKTDVRIIIGKLRVEEINVVNILSGIANTEMGFDPAIEQTIYFFDPLTNKAFQMYDDRGCYVWSDNANKIRDIYINRNEWIVEYHRPEIDEYFKIG